MSITHVLRDTGRELALGRPVGVKLHSHILSDGGRRNVVLHSDGGCRSAHIAIVAFIPQAINE